MGNLGKDEYQKLLFYASIVACCCFPVTILLVLALLIRKVYHKCKCDGKKRRVRNDGIAREDSLVSGDVSLVYGIQNLFLMRKMWKEDGVVHIECEWGTQQVIAPVSCYTFAVQD
eukprot:1333770-Rhodomonas_salina.1